MVNLTNPHGQTTNFQYDGLSRMTRKSLANGAYSTYSYDAANRLLILVNKKSDDSNLSSYTYTYDNAGNLSAMTTLAGTHSYNYDKIYQLMQATHPVSSAENYTYDPVFNRLTSSDHNDWTYDSNNRLLSYNGFTFAYDANGSMTKKTETTTSKVTSYQYDYDNRLKRIDYPDGTYSEYRYDPFGNRINKDVNGTVTWFVYDLMKPLPDVIGEYDESGSLTVAYTHGPGIDDVISMRRDGSNYFYLKDALGSVASLTDATEASVNNYEYDSFGKVVNRTENVTNPYGYTGKRLDRESGLMYYRARYYDPSIGRFASEDLIRFYDNVNYYNYANNNPMRYVDPDGRLAVVPIVIVLLGVLEVVWGTTCMNYAIERSRQYFHTDKQQHCYASCFFNRCMLLQPGITFLGGVLHELLVPKYGLKDAIRDITANIYGIISSYTFSSCIDKCKVCPIMSD